MGAGTEEQRLQILQQLQSQAQQGDSQAAAALSNLNSDMVAMSSQMQVMIQIMFIDFAISVASQRNLSKLMVPLASLQSENTG